MIEQFETARPVRFGLFLAHDRFPQEIDRESDLLFVAAAERFNDLLRVFSGDKLARHAGNVPPQDERADPRRNFGDAHAGP